MPPASPPGAASFAPFKPHFVRGLGAVEPRPTLARFEVGGGLRVLLRDSARRELNVQVAPPGAAPGAVYRSEASAVDLLPGTLPAEDVPTWTAEVIACVRVAEAQDGWAAFLAGAWTSPVRG